MGLGIGIHLLYKGWRILEGAEDENGKYTWKSSGLSMIYTLSSAIWMFIWTLPVWFVSPELWLSSSATFSAAILVVAVILILLLVPKDWKLLVIPGIYLTIVSTIIGIFIVVNS